jgi:glycosyltransferase involved in cell wall biosynthesis
MRILFVTPFYYPEHKFGGPPRKIHALASGLMRRKFEVMVTTFDFANAKNRERSAVENIPVQYLRWIGKGLRQLPLDRRLLSSAISDAHVIHCYGLYNFLCPLAMQLAHRHHKPAALEPLGMYPPRAKNRLAKLSYNWAITRRMIRQSQGVIATSKSELKDLQEIVPPDKLAYRPNGIDLERFKNLPPADKLRIRWNLSPQERVVLFIGRISPIKNLEQLIIAFAEADVPKARLLLVGPSLEERYMRKLRSIVSAKQLERRVTFAGPLYEEEQRAALALADLFVLSSLNESFGNAAGEAVAADVPVLLTNTCGIAPLIDRRAGLAVPLGVESLAKGLKVMLDPVQRDALTSQREHVKRELSWDEPIQQTIELYKRIVEGKAKRGVTNAESRK